MLVKGDEVSLYLRNNIRDNKAVIATRGLGAQVDRYVPWKPQKMALL